MLQPRQTSFGAARWVSILATAFMLLLLPFGIDGLISGHTEEGIYALLFLGMIPAGLWRQIQKLDLKSDHLIIEFCFWRRKRVSFEEISSINLIDAPAPYGGKPAKTILIARTSGQKIELRGFKDDSLAIIESIESACKACRKSEHRDSKVQLRLVSPDTITER
jgi:hypothetical protein